MFPCRLPDTQIKVLMLHVQFVVCFLRKGLKDLKDLIRPLKAL